tara:strand:- start:741 stop:995 length:255 start_codon:yes stop_codon:yes gene_type:complete
MDFFQKEHEQLISLQKDIENTDSIETNTAAYLSSKIQEIRASLRSKNGSLQEKTQKTVETKPLLNFKKPASVSLADQKKKEYFF